MFLRMRSYAVNARKADWKIRAYFTWASMLFFTSFHKAGTTMLPTMRNMVLESVALLFLVTRDDVSQPRRNTSECNEHTYGLLRKNQREFLVEQFIRLVDQMVLKMNCIFQSNLAITRSNVGKGYQKTFPEFVSSLKAAATDTPKSGPVEVDLDEKAVNQLWPLVRRVIREVNALMLPFLKILGVEEGHGLSPFLSEIKEPEDLLRIVKDFFPYKGEPGEEDCWR